jgi:membrane-bound lytic murein transglycosylase D
MTKRKRVHAGLFSVSLFLSAVGYGKTGEQQPADPQQKGMTKAAQVLTKSAISAVVADSSIVNPSGFDSLEVVKELYGSEMSSAPKVTLNTKASSFVKTYLEQNRETLQDVEERSDSYFSTIATIFSQYNLPDELKYLAVVESKLKHTATSRAGAAGLWQLMPATARALGLKISGKTDERRQFHKSTVAAAKYLKSLYNTYGDWLLVLAAYNAGSGNVNKAIQKSGSRNFWHLQQYLPAETRVHVKRYIGVHYYFEQEGGLTTLTKQEWKDYQQELDTFLKEREQERIELKRLVAIDDPSVTPPPLPEIARGK